MRRFAVMSLVLACCSSVCWAQVPGDADGDGALTSGDMAGLVAEVHDDDGTAPASAPYASYPGSPGADTNGDGAIGVGDLPSALELLFGGAVISFDASSYVVEEATTDVTVTVELDRVAAHTITVAYATSDGTATTAGSDYTAASGTLTFVPGDVSETFDVPILGDGDSEGTEFLTLTLSAPTGGVIAGATAPLSILDGGDSPVQVDAVAPGQVVEGSRIRVYSSALAGVPTVTLVVTHASHADVVLRDLPVVSDGWVEAVLDPISVPAESTPWGVALEFGPGITTPSVAALQVAAAGSASTPIVVTGEEDPTCGEECAHRILSGQTLRGEWFEAGDADRFTFAAGEGATVRLTLTRVDDSLAPDHPDAPTPELLLLNPAGLVETVAPLPGIDAAGTSLDATLLRSGVYTALVRSEKTTADYATRGGYLLTYDETAEGTPGAFMLNPESRRALVTTGAEPQVVLVATVLDPYGHVAGGVGVE